MSEQVTRWLDEADDATRLQVSAAIEALANEGPSFGRPFVDTITGSKYKNMKELRPGSPGKTEIRILFIFDPVRQAYLILAGDKAGKWNKWYKTNIPLAESLYDEYLEELSKNETNHLG